MTMPKFGILTNPTIDILKEIETIGKLKFDFVEIGIEWPEGAPEILLKKKNQIINLLEKYNLFAVGHTAWWIDFATSYDLVRRGWLEESKKKIETAYELGTKLLNFHAHAREATPFYKKYRKIILDNFIDGLRELVIHAKKYGIKIMLENPAEKGEITYFKDFKYVVDRIPTVKIHLDIGHAFIFGGMKNIRNYITVFGNKIEHVHMHDNRGKFDEHLPIGKGRINFSLVVKMLKKIGYDKTITFEVFTSKKDAKKSMEKIKKLWLKV